MNLDLKKLQQIVRERNEITISALECASFVLDRARQIPDHKPQELMLELVKTLISPDPEQ
ncbi:MAG: hypothetical protein R6U13_05050 [Desulfatiglandaceae bacterium]